MSSYATPKGLNRLKTIQVTGEVVDEGEEKKEPEYDEYCLEDAARTLQRAEEIKADTKLMKALTPYLDKSVKSLKGLRRLASKKAMADLKKSE